MKVNTTRFGELEINKQDIIEFPDGLLGFESLKKFFIVDPGDSTLILWLQSIENDKIAFPVIEPRVFKADYVVKLLPTDLNSLEMENLENAKIYSILTIPENVQEMSANLKAPIIVNTSKDMAKQIVLQDNKLSVKYEMYKDYKLNVIARTSDDTKRTFVNEQNISQDSVTSTEQTNERTVKRDLELNS